MPKYFYNKVTRTCGVKQHVKCTKVSDPHYAWERKWAWHAVKAGEIYQDPFRHFAPQVINTVEELSTLMKKAGFSGSMSFIDAEGSIYSINQVGAFEFAPLEHDGQQADTGINWATKFFFTEEAALAFGKSLNEGRKPDSGYFRWDRPEYHEDLDTWSVHYHCYAD